uniref:Protein kinase domain-containing protein n=1 Tax=Polytomella parva TaxID=51329 RepID=A0A7S0VEY4_9CHLO
MDQTFNNLKLSSRSDVDSELERLRQENKDLKRQLAGGAGLSGLNVALEDLDIQDQIGGGGFSLVHRGFWRGTPVTIKKWFDPNMTDELFAEFRAEVTTLSQLRHPNILQLLGASLRAPDLLMVTEHLPFSLHSVLYQQGIDLDKKKIVGIAQDICRAFIYLHGQKPALIHRDIKPANFLLDRAWKVKVCDFGLASNTREQTGAGTPPYMAPELLSGKPYNEKVDVYAFGVLLNEMLGREAPFLGLDVPSIRSRVLAGGRPDVPLSCPRPFQEMIQLCWDEDSKKRPTFVQLLDSLKAIAKEL